LIKLEVKPDAGPALAERVISDIRQQVKKNIGLSPEISLEPRDSLPRFELKARRFRDLRTKAQ
jgi:phenylacetate-coenzyme A ligase PaaK-like adenylate-forming protein